MFPRIPSTLLQLASAGGRQSQLRLSNCRKLNTTAFSDVPIDILTFKTSAKFASVLCDLQSSLTLPWWVTIVGGTLICRTILVIPTQLYGFRIMQKLKAIQPELQATFKRIQDEVRMAHIVNGWSNLQARRVLKQRLTHEQSELYAKHNCHPFKSFIILPYELALWIYVSVCLRDTIVIREHYNARGFNIDRLVGNGSTNSKELSNQQQVEARLRCLNELAKLPSGGTLWFSNLCVRDAFYVLPVVFCGLLLNSLNSAFKQFSSNQVTKLAMAQQLRARATGAKSKLDKHAPKPREVDAQYLARRLRNFGRIQKVMSLSAAGSVLYVICGLPAFMNLFWCVSSLHALCVRRVLPSLGRRIMGGRASGTPTNPSTSST